MQPARHHHLESLTWDLSGYAPTGWKAKSMELGFILEPEAGPVRIKRPGSVQGALRDAGILPDWHVGFQSRDCK